MTDLTLVFSQQRRQSKRLLEVSSTKTKSYSCIRVLLARYFIRVCLCVLQKAGEEKKEEPVPKKVKGEIPMALQVFFN